MTNKIKTDDKNRSLKRHFSAKLKKKRKKKKFPDRIFVLLNIFFKSGILFYRDSAWFFSPFLYKLLLAIAVAAAANTKL